MSDLILPTCERCGGPKYVRGEPWGYDEGGQPLFVYWECQCKPPAEPVPIPDPSVADSIRRAGGWVMNCGYMAKDGDLCPCCGSPVRLWKNEYGGQSDNIMGSFYHDGRLAWACQDCWDKHTHHEPTPFTPDELAEFERIHEECVAAEKSGEVWVGYTGPAK